jgi:hypothetical protein
MSDRCDDRRDTTSPVKSAKGAPVATSEYPPFNEAVESFRGFLKNQGLPDSIRWVWREDICTRRAPGSRRSWNRWVFVNLAGDFEASLAEAYYNFGSRQNNGLALEVFCVAAGNPCCYIYMPDDETDASYRMLAGLHLKVPEKPIVAIAVTRPLLWKSLQLFIGTPNNAWINDVPRKVTVPVDLGANPLGGPSDTNNR